MDQTNLLENIVKFNNKSRPKTKKGNDKKQNTFDSVNTLYEGRELTLNAFRSGIFPIKATQGKGRPRMLASHPLDLAKQLKIFMNPKNSKTSDPHILLLNIKDKIDFRRKDKYIALSNLSIYCTWKNHIR